MEDQGTDAVQQETQTLETQEQEAEVATVTVEDEGTPVEQEQQPQEEGGDEGEKEGGDDGGQEAEQPEKQEEEGAAETGAAAATPSQPSRQRVRTTIPSEGVDIAVGDSGVEAEEPVTFGQMFQETVRHYPDHPALKHKEGDAWRTITYAEYYNLCIRAAKSFLKLGLEPYHGVNIIGFNSTEWLIANNGAIFAGGLPAGIYTTNNAEACHFVAENCKANVIVVENQKQLDKILEIRDRLPHLRAIVQYKGKLSQEYPDTYDWEQFMKLGDGMEDSVVEEKMAAQSPEQCALLVYTSGTTGNPKGVMLSHDNLVWTAKSFHASYGMDHGIDRIVSYLPLSHIAAQMADIHVPIFAAAAVSFAQPDALKGTLGQTLKEVQPTFFFGVPRVWEKIKERMQSLAANVTGFKKTIATWAKDKGLRGNMNIQKGASLPWGWTVANLLVFRKVRDALGFTYCKGLLTGAAPIHREVLDYFMSVNLPVLELYGMSECSGPHTFNLMNPGGWRVGSVGKTMQGVKVKIDTPDENGDGEICFYGRHVFMGYLNSDEKTREAIDDEGWLHSGDIGRVDEDGFLYITGRIKELIITSGGENMAPVPIEDRIKQEVPFLSNVMVIGDKRKYVTCIVTLKCVVDPETGEPQDELLPQAKQMIADLGSKCTTVSEIVSQKDEAVYRAIEDGLDRANQHSVSRAQKVQKFHLVIKDFSVPGGELGPTLKLRRRSVVQKYLAEIDGMYEETSAQ